MNQLDVLEILKFIWPLIVVQFALQIFCIVKVAKQGVANLRRWIWILIIILFNTIGPILFLIIGRSRSESHD